MEDEIKASRKALTEKINTGINMRYTLIPPERIAVISRSVESLLNVSIDEISTDSGIASTKKRGIMKTANLTIRKKLIPVSDDILENLITCCMRNADNKTEMLRIKEIVSSVRMYLSRIFAIMNFYYTINSVITKEGQGSRQP